MLYTSLLLTALLLIGTRGLPFKPQGLQSSLAGNKPLPIEVEVLGITEELNTSFISIGRDGGGGGIANGHNVIVFSDTFVNGIGPISNTIAYSGEDGRSTLLLDFGENGVPKQAIPYTQNETDYNLATLPNSRVAIWFSGSLANIPTDPEKLVGVASAVYVTEPSFTDQYPSGDIYNTLFTVTAGETPVVDRVVPVLWEAGSVLYGTFATFLNPRDELLYFFAADGPGIKMARANPSLDYGDKTTWSFWNGQTWSLVPSPQGSMAGTIIAGALNPDVPGVDENSVVYSSGDFFYSKKYQTFVTIYFLADIDSTFRYRYIIPNQSGRISLTGPWSDEFLLLDTNELVAPGGYGFNYAGHAYPGEDESGETVLLSCTLSDGYTPYFWRARLGELAGF